MREWRRSDGEDSAHVCPAPRADAPITREAIEKFYRRTPARSGRNDAEVIADIAQTIAEREATVRGSWAS
jgi:hypothetical protein